MIEKSLLAINKNIILNPIRKIRSQASLHTFLLLYFLIQLQKIKASTLIQVVYVKKCCSSKMIAFLNDNSTGS